MNTNIMTRRTRRLRTLHYFHMALLVATIGLITGCAPTVVLPTQASLPTIPPSTPTPRPPTRTPVPAATATPTPTPTLAVTVTPLALEDSGTILSIDSTPVKLESRRITFILRATPRTSKIARATLFLNYPKTKQTSQSIASLTPQKLGEPIPPIQFSISVDVMPVHEDQINYYWHLSNEAGQVFKSPEAVFKLTEAIASERRDDLPIIEAETQFTSDFPKKATFTLTITPKSPIAYANFLITQNQGIALQSFPVKVSRKPVGQTLVLDFVWYNQFGLQIPWQAFETWWVLTDERGKTWRTDPVTNDYADNRFHKWTRTPTKHAILFTYNQSKANIDALAKATDASYERLAEAFGYRLIYEPHVVVYNNQRDFEDWSPPVLAELFIGMASGDWGGCVVTLYDTIDFTGYAIIQHELVHLFQFQSLRQPAPQWWVEGSARYFEQKNPEYDKIVAVVKRVLANYGVTNLTLKMSSRPPDGSGYPWPYYVGMTIVKYIIETYGEDAFRKIHIAAARDISYVDALKMATGKSIPQLNQEWGAWILAQ